MDKAAINKMNSLIDQRALDTFGMTAAEAIERGVCIRCKNSAAERIYSIIGKEEYKISGLCELCFDEITDPSNFDEGDNVEEEPAF